MKHYDINSTLSRRKDEVLSTLRRIREGDMNYSEAGEYLNDDLGEDLVNALESAINYIASLENESKSIPSERNKGVLQSVLDTVKKEADKLNLKVDSNLKLCTTDKNQSTPIDTYRYFAQVTYKGYANSNLDCTNMYPMSKDSYDAFLDIIISWDTEAGKALYNGITYADERGIRGLLGLSNIPFIKENKISEKDMIPAYNCLRVTNDLVFMHFTFRDKGECTVEFKRQKCISVDKEVN